MRILLAATFRIAELLHRLVLHVQSEENACLDENMCGCGWLVRECENKGASEKLIMYTNIHAFIDDQFIYFSTDGLFHPYC